MTPDEWQLRDAWLAEMWPVCRERPREIRVDWSEFAAGEGYVSCVSCGVVFRQPRDARAPFKWCPECVAEAAL